MLYFDPQERFENEGCPVPVSYLLSSCDLVYFTQSSGFVMLFMNIFGFVFFEGQCESAHCALQHKPSAGCFKQPRPLVRSHCVCRSVRWCFPVSNRTWRLICTNCNGHLLTGLYLETSMKWRLKPSLIPTKRKRCTTTGWCTRPTLLRKSRTPSQMHWHLLAMQSSQQKKKSWALLVFLHQQDNNRELLRVQDSVLKRTLRGSESE